MVSAAVADTDYQQVITWGDGLTYSAPTASVDFNSTNLQITASQINTIQDIATTSSPAFASLDLTGTLTTDTIGEHISRSEEHTSELQSH